MLYLIIIGFCAFTLTSIYKTINLRLHLLGERIGSLKTLLRSISKIDYMRLRDYLLVFIKNPRKIIKILFALVRFIAKIMIRIISIFASNRHFKGMWYSILSGYILASFLIFTYGKSENINIFISFAATLGILIATWFFMEVGSKISLIEETYGLTHYIMIFLLIFLLAFTGLIPYEKMKNNGVHDPSTLYFLFALSLYIMAILAKALKGVLDKGELWLSALGGIFIYIVFLLFSTLAVGFYFSAVSPEIFPKPNLNTNLTESEVFSSYIAHYSFLGAKQLSQFPVKEINIPLRILYSEYITYTVGLFVNLIMIAFFVSYTVSVHILKKSDKDSYNAFLRTPNYIAGYTKYLERKIKRIFVMILREFRLFKRQQINRRPGV